MKRLVGIMMGIVFLVAGIGSAKAASVTLSYANFPPAKTFPCVQMERWKKEVEQRTNGKVAINTFPGGTLLGAKNMLRGVMQGQADIGCLCMAYQPGVFPLTTVAGLPVGFTSSQVASKALYAMYEKYDPKAFQGVKVLTMFTSAPSNLMTKEPVKTLDDLQGLEIRASGSASRILDLLGVTPVSMPMPETPEALQKGVVKGLLSSLEVLKDFNFAAYCPYQTMTNFQVYPFAVIMNKSVWNSLPEDVQKVMDDLRAEQAEWTGVYMDNHVQEAIKYANSTYNARQFTFSKAEMATIAETIKPVITEWKDRATQAGLPAEAIYSDLLQFKAEYEK